ncbi:ABC transporter permease [Cellulomonas sp. URHE0023]|uniref:ABC transporter permease n=1 Tax=Cellulomonas sp. URHE0023 TaxID=1380354 RepID=UPI0004874D63|nr:ABC transporter permease [Cellulomonas sp. URHE0023]
MSQTLTPARTVPLTPSPATRWRRTLLGRDSAVVGLLIVVVIAASVLVPGFASTTTWYYLLLDVFPILLIALPMTLVIISAEIDLSVASMLGLSSVIVGSLFEAGWPLPAAAAVALVVGAVGGWFNGFLITRVGLPSLAVTIGTLALFRGIAVGILGTRAVTGFPDWAQNLVTSRIGPIPSVIFLFLVLAAIFWITLHATAVGRVTYAAGLNAEAAQFAGARVGRLKLGLFVATGVMSALAGVYWTLRYGTARGDNAVGLELSVVAAVLVGGVSIFGGRGGIVGVIAGVLVIGALRSALRLADVSSDVINVITGFLLIATVIAPGLWARFGERLRRRTT